MTRFLTVALLVGCALSSVAADDKNRIVLDEKEQAFADLMQDAVLVGNFTVNRSRPADESGGPRGKQTPERYGIKSIQKVSDDQWLVNSQIKYGKLDVTVPVPVQVHFANDTPVLSVTDLTIPLVGSEFTARVMFYDDQYAGTWRHGKVGGLMYGKVEKAAPAPAPVAPPTAGETTTKSNEPSSGSTSGERPSQPAKP
ncbi:hypothetical protein Pan44_30340 [Caulifigura coniformis]|uniref:Uncharacterized protein n=1 Tax=Caulifigura coniformis TaxID=2527983 RepID=A0A517SFU6_9PLAN|nr:hypothetical protein [Caulifigura coniformis]QDT54993.1 hypothetical protein Pan44_30340 [Caulifigura coniformis]